MRTNLITDKDQEIAAQKMLECSFKFLSSLGREEESDLVKLTAKDIVFALSVAGKEKKQIELTALESASDSTNYYASVYAESCDVVASAFWLVSNKIEYEEDMAPISCIGQTYIRFAEAMHAAESISNALDVLGDNGFSFEYSVGGAEFFADANNSDEKQ